MSANFHSYFLFNSDMREMRAIHGKEITVRQTLNEDESSHQTSYIMSCLGFLYCNS